MATEAAEVEETAAGAEETADAEMTADAETAARAAKPEAANMQQMMQPTTIFNAHAFDDDAVLSVFLFKVETTNLSRQHLQ